MLCVVVLVEGFCVGRLPERIVDRQGRKARFRTVQCRANFHQENRIAQLSNPASGKRKPEVSSRTITFEIRPKLEALDPKHYREIQQSKLDRTVARIPSAGLQQQRRLFLSDWMITNNALSQIRPAGGEAGANKRR